MPSVQRRILALGISHGGILYGRRIYELMRYWDEEHPEGDAAECEFADAWRSQPKWVVSRSLRDVGPNDVLLVIRLDGSAGPRVTSGTAADHCGYPLGFILVKDPPPASVNGSGAIRLALCDRVRCGTG